MRTVITLPMIKNRKIPLRFQKDDNRFPEILVENFLMHYTEPGDKVIDIFAGLGTTLLVAEELEREAFGIELDKDRFEYVRTILTNKQNIFNENSLNLDKLNLPKMDFAFGSPTYMNEFERENPLTGFTEKGTYQDYLEFLKEIYSKLKKVMKKGAYVVIEVSNLKYDKKITTLAWDIGKTISDVFRFEGEIIINWTTPQEDVEFSYGYGYDHSYCLVFKK